MKLRSCILAIYVLLLALEPCGQVFPCISSSPPVEECTAGGCCTEEGESPVDEQEAPGQPDCCQGSANPFSPCGCCFIMATATPVHTTAWWSGASKQFSLYSAGMSCGYIADCFHPPEPARS